MIATLLGLVILVVVLGVIWWAINQLLPLIPIEEPFRTILRVLLVLILVVVVIYIIIALLGVGGIHVNTFGFR